MDSLFSERFNELLKESNYTYEELAEKLGFKSRSAITKYANGNVKNVTISTVENIANVFNVSPSWLAGFSSNKYEKNK